MANLGENNRIESKIGKPIVLDRVFSPFKNEVTANLSCPFPCFLSPNYRSTIFFALHIDKSRPSVYNIGNTLPKNMPKAIGAVVYPLVCALHGLAFGTLYAPAQALMFGMSFEQTVAWIVTGLPWDAIHMAGNFAFGLLILPLYKILTSLVKGKI